MRSSKGCAACLLEILKADPLTSFALGMTFGGPCETSLDAIGEKLCPAHVERWVRANKNVTRIVQEDVAREDAS